MDPELLVGSGCKLGQIPDPDPNTTYFEPQHCYNGHQHLQTVLWSRSRPEPDFLAGAGAGASEKALAPDPGCCCLA